MQPRDVKDVGGAAAARVAQAQIDLSGLPPALQALARTGALDDLVREIPEAEVNLLEAQRVGDLPRVNSLTSLLVALRARQVMITTEPPLAARVTMLQVLRGNDCVDCQAGIPCQAHQLGTFSPRCHPEAGMVVAYHLGSNTALCSCKRCQRPIVRLVLAETIPQELLNRVPTPEPAD